MENTVKHLLSNLTLVALVLTSAAAFAQDPNYTLSVTDASGASGDMVMSSVMLDSTAGDDNSGWSYGVRQDSTVGTLVDAVLGATALTVNGGDEPDFVNINQFPDEGYNVGVVINLFGAEVLAPGAGYELSVATYELTGSGSAPLTIAEDLGSPPVAVVIVVAGASIPPTIENGTLEVIAGVATGFHYTVTAPATLSQGTGFDAEFTLSNDEATAPVTQGFSIGLAHDNTVLDADLPVAIGELAALDGGGGPDFFGATDTGDGVTLGCVYSFLGAETLTFDAVGSAILTIPYSSADPTFVGTTDLDFLNTLGTPPVDNVVVGGQSIDPVSFTGTTVEFTAGAVLASFETGDTNQDAKKNVADPVYLLNFLFAGGPDLDCPASGDSDGDGSLDTDDAILMLENYFTGGAPLADPFGACGTRAGVEAADCTFVGCP